VIAAGLLAASLLAPAGVTASIQADPVCLPVTAQPGHSYPLTVWVQGGGALTLAVVPETTGLSARLHQVPASWVSFSRNPASGTTPLTLAVPADAAPGPYESKISGTTGSAASSGGGAQARTGAAGTTAIVFTVGPSATPPPPCDALDLAQSTGRFPPWPSKAFATSSWKQVFARERAARPAPEDTCPTATAGLAARSAPSYCPGAGSGPSAGLAYSPAATATQAAGPPMSPVADPAPSGTPKIPSDWPGWLVIGLILLGLAALRKRFGS
jgi:hypothetical protein